MPMINFYINNVSFRFRNRKKLKLFIPGLFSSQRKGLISLNYIFCTDDELLEINKKYLNHDEFTDILTFDLSDEPGNIIGEVYISIDRVEDNSIINKEPFERELHRVIFHGALHLTGQGDKTMDEARQMRNLEDKYLEEYFQCFT
jgi:rRNA maturation RNase YbeY